ncbi:MAG: hypothetical protein RL419_465, partial [Actinomycetota bacterium]
ASDADHLDDGQIVLWCSGHRPLPPSSSVVSREWVNAYTRRNGSVEIRPLQDRLQADFLGLSPKWLPSLDRDVTCGDIDRSQVRRILSSQQHHDSHQLVL